MPPLQDNATPAPTSAWYDPATLPDAPVSDDFPALLCPLPLSEGLTDRDKEIYATADREATDLQRRFVRLLYWSRPRNITKCAVLAGYTANGAAKMGSQTLKSAHVSRMWSILTADRAASLPGLTRPATREQVAIVLSAIVLASPEDMIGAMEDLTAGLSTPRTRAPIYSKVWRKGEDGFGVELCDRLTAAKLLADLSGWRVSRDAASGAQAALDEILDAIATQGRGGSKPANKPPKPANTDDEE